MVSLVLLCVFLFFVAFSAFVGFVRGMNKSVIRLITLAFAMVLTFFASALTTNLIAKNLLIEGQTLGELVLGMISSEEMIVSFLEAAPLLKEAILVAPAFAIAIVIFPVMFLILSFISWIVFCCIQKSLRRKMFKEQFPKNRQEKKEMKKNRKPFLVRLGKRFAGFGIGAVTGALIFGMLFAPLFGIISIVPENNALYDVIDTMVDQEILDASTAQTIKDELAVRDGAIIKGYVGAALAGKLYLSAVSRFEYDGLKTNIPAEFDSVFSVVQVAIEGGLLKAALNAEDMSGIFAVLSKEEVVNELISEMFKSQLFCAAIPEVMAIAMQSVAISLQVPADKNAVYDNMMEDIADSVKDADIDYEGIKAYENAQVATDYVAADEAPIMTQEEYEAEIQKLADLTLKISKIINTAVSGSNETISGTLAGQIVENVKTEIMANGEGALDGFNAHSVKTTISDISSNNTDASAQSVLDKMSDSAKFETEVATVESITESIRSSVKSAVEDKSKAQETASTLATVVCNFAGAVESAIDENGNMDIAKFDFAKVADAVTALQNSNLKEVGSSVLDLVISGDLGEGGEIVSNTIGALKDSYNNGEDIGGTINSAGALIVLGTTMGNGGDGSKENIANSFKDLIQNLNETTLNLLSTVLSEESLVSMGVEKAYAAIAYDVVDALLRELMELKNSSNYENEVNTVLSIYDILSAGNIEEAQIGDLIRQVLKSQVVMNTLDRVSTDILSADLLISLNVPKDFADEICTAVTICVDEMLAIRNSDAAAYNAEIDALVTMFMSLEGKDKGDQLADVLREMLKSNVIMNMLDKAAHDILSPEFLVSLDVPEKYAKEICTAVVGCLDEMLELRNTDTAAYNAEIDALIATFVSLEDKDLNEDENLAELFRQIFDSKVVMNMLDKVASDVLTANLLTSMNVPEQYAEDVCTVIETLVKELTVLGAEESYTYDNEVNAILVVKKLVNKTNGSFTKDDINSLIDCAKNSEAIYNTLMKISGSVVIEISEADRESVINGIESYYAESQKTEKDRNIFNSVAKILGVTVNLQ